MSGFYQDSGSQTSAYDYNYDYDYGPSDFDTGPGFTIPDVASTEPFSDPSPPMEFDADYVFSYTKPDIVQNDNLSPRVEGDEIIIPMTTNDRAALQQSLYRSGDKKREGGDYTGAANDYLLGDSIGKGNADDSDITKYLLYGGVGLAGVLASVFGNERSLKMQQKENELSRQHDAAMKELEFGYAKELKEMELEKGGPAIKTAHARNVFKA